MDDSGCTSILVVAQYTTWGPSTTTNELLNQGHSGRMRRFAIHSSMLDFMDNPDSYGDAGTTDMT